MSSMCVEDSVGLSGLDRASGLNGSSHKRDSTVCSPGKSRTVPANPAGRVLVSLGDTSHTLPASVNKTSKAFRLNGNDPPPSALCSAIHTLSAFAVAHGLPLFVGNACGTVCGFRFPKMVLTTELPLYRLRTP